MILHLSENCWQPLILHLRVGSSTEAQDISLRLSTAFLPACSSSELLRPFAWDIWLPFLCRDAAVTAMTLWLPMTAPTPLSQWQRPWRQPRQPPLPPSRLCPSRLVLNGDCQKPTRNGLEFFNTLHILCIKAEVSQVGACQKNGEKERRRRNQLLQLFLSNFNGWCVIHWTYDFVCTNTSDTYHFLSCLPRICAPEVEHSTTNVCRFAVSYSSLALSAWRQIAQCTKKMKLLSGVQPLRGTQQRTWK